MQKKQKEEPQKLTENFELKINKQAIGYVVSQMKDCLKSNDLTKNISLEKNKENKSGEMEGLEIRNDKLYLKGSLVLPFVSMCGLMKTIPSCLQPISRFSKQKQKTNAHAIEP